MMWQSFIEDHGESPIPELNLSTLAVDEAFLRISSLHDQDLSVYQKSSLCFMCPYKRTENLTSRGNLTLKYDTNSLWSFIFTSLTDDFIKYPGKSDEEVCFVQDVTMGEFGIYEIDVNPSECEFKILKNPVFVYGALILAIVFYFLVGVGFVLLRQIYRNVCGDKKRRKCQTDAEMPVRRPPTNMTYFGNPEQTVKVVQNTVKKRRIQSLDTFRGITIILMILVNHGGGSYWFLEHAPWNGLYLADVIFPWFLWIMGVCIPMGMRSQLKKKTPKFNIFLQIFQRSLKLFAIGLILNTVGGHNQLETIRIPGVLQRFAISYFVTATVYLLCGPAVGKGPIKGIFSGIEDIIILFPQWVIYILLIIGYGVFIFYMPVPGCPRGYLGPGGIVLLQDGLPSPNCIGGVTKMVDIWILGENHIYQNPTAKHIYSSSAFDPEGILGSVPTLLQVFLGIQAGQILQTFENPKARIKRWMIWGAITLLASLVLSSGIIIGGPIPVNKNLWSLSYVFITSALAFTLLTVCYILVDYSKIWSGSPFYQTGMNSIFLYVAHFVTYNIFPWRYRYGEMRTHLALFTEALFGTTLWILVALYLHRKKLFYTV